MVVNKYNVLHWHLVDDESFPIEIDSLKRLTKYGAYSPYERYTTEDVSDLIEFARF
eukprot:Awhi_evm1s12754